MKSEQPATGLDWQQTLFSRSLKAKHFWKNLSHLQKRFFLPSEVQEFSSCPLQRSSWQQMASVTKPSQLKALDDLSSFHMASWAKAMDPQRIEMLTTNEIFFMMKDSQEDWRFPFEFQNRLAIAEQFERIFLLERWESATGTAEIFLRISDKWLRLRPALVGLELLGNTELNKEEVSWKIKQNVPFA